jgi:hypothetical protein
MRIGSLLIGAGLLGYGALQIMGRIAGTTFAERRAQMPGDDVVDDATTVTNHAVDIAVPPDRVWPWLAQMGWHLGGFYTPGWVDRLFFPANGPSLNHLDPALIRRLRAGDIIPDGPPGTAWYVVHEIEAPHTLVLHSTTHVPVSWRSRFGATIDWTWAFVLSETANGGTRLQLRVRGHTSPWWLAAAYQAVIVPADAIMAVGMLGGIKSRVEAAAAGGPGPRHRRRTRAWSTPGPMATDGRDQ